MHIHCCMHTHIHTHTHLHTHTFSKFYNQKNSLYKNQSLQDIPQKTVILALKIFDHEITIMYKNET